MSTLGGSQIRDRVAAEKLGWTDERVRHDLERRPFGLGLADRPQMDEGSTERGVPVELFEPDPASPRAVGSLDCAHIEKPEHSRTLGPWIGMR